MSITISNQLNRNETVTTIVNDAVRQTQAAVNSLVTNDIPAAIMTAQGDIVYRNATVPARLAAGTAGQVLQTNGSSANPTWVNPAWTIVAKTSDESRSSTTSLTNDGALTFAVAANTKYRWRATIFYTTGATPDFKWDWNGPASPTFVAVMDWATTSDGTVSSQTIATAFAVAGTILAGAVTGGIMASGVLQNGANAGTVAFRWAQNTSDPGGTVVKAGSFLEYATV